MNDEKATGSQGAGCCRSRGGTEALSRLLMSVRGMMGTEKTAAARWGGLNKV